MRHRTLAAAVASAAIAMLGVTGAAQAPAAVPGLTIHAKTLDLRQGFQVALHHTRTPTLAGVVYARHRAPARHTTVTSHRATRQAACTEPDCALSYQGGVIQQHPHVYLLLWGPAWSSDPAQEASASYLENFYSGLGVAPADTWSPITSQYGNGTSGPGFGGSVLVTTYQDTNPPPSGATASQLAAEAQAFAAKQGISDPANADVVVATQSGTCPAGFAAPCNGTSGKSCGWHSMTTGSPQVPFVDLPYQPDAMQACGESLVQGTDDGFSIVGGAEYADTITDPDLGTGWQDTGDTGGGEVGSKCEWTDPVTRNSDLGTVSLSTGTFAAQPLFSNAAFSQYGDGCVMAPGQDTVSVTNPGVQTVSADGSLTLPLTATSSGKLALSWTSTGLPAGLSLSTSGVISGTPTSANFYTSRVTATDTSGAADTAVIYWTVNAVTGKALTGDGGKCLDDSGAATANGNKIDIWRCNGTGAQRWTFANGVLVVLGKCLSDAAWGGTGTPLTLWTCNGKPVQQWRHKADGEYVLAHNGLCLTDPDGSQTNGTQVILRSCYGGKDQAWSVP